MSAELPFVDEHFVEVAATPQVTWRALLSNWERPLPTWFARLLGCADLAPIPGFHVQRSEEPTCLVLAGRHRFARYLLTFHLQASHRGTLLRAETRAEFPGLLGRIYRLLVIGSRLHVVATRFILARVRHKAEKLARNI